MLEIQLRLLPHNNHTSQAYHLKLKLGGYSFEALLAGHWRSDG